MISRAMLQAATDATGFTFSLDEAKGGRYVLAVIGSDKTLATSPALSEPKIEAFLLGLLAGVQCSRRAETVETAK